MTSPSRSPRQRQNRTVRVGVGLCGLLVAGSFVPATAGPAPTASTAPVAVSADWVDLGAAADYSVLGGAGVANTGAGTVLAKDLGLSPTGVIAGFPPGTVNGAVHDKDGVAAAAQEDRATAYDDAAGQPSTTTFTGDQAGKTFPPGVHTTIAAFTNTGTITLDAAGDPGAVFVFQVGAAFSSAAATKVVLKNGALANNVVWQVVGAVSLGADATFVGTFLGAGAVTLGAGVSLKGRVLTPGTVALTNNPLTEPQDDLTAPVVAIDGGAARSSNDTTPPITGLVDEPAGRLVSVAVAGQELTTRTTAGGRWSVSAAALSEGDHLLVASVADASQNVGTASQLLTVDVTAPAVGIDGPALRATADTTPGISGTSGEPAGTAVRVTVAGQELTSTVGTDGSWSVVPGPLTESSHLVEAAVRDTAGNPGSALQVLEIDLTLPVVTIDGGAARTTSDTSPWTYGTSGERAGTQVRLAVGGQDLVAVVRAGGGWSVSATTMPPGTYPVVASVADAAGNTSVARQTLTVGSPPVVPPVDPPVVPASRYRPDAAVRGRSGSFVGAGVYHPTAQTVDQLVPRRRAATFQVRLTNRGDAADRLMIRGTARNEHLRVVYRAGRRDVTAAVVGGRYVTARLAPGRSVVLVVEVTRSPAARAGRRRGFDVYATSTQAPAVRDRVRALART